MTADGEFDPSALKKKKKKKSKAAETEDFEAKLAEAGMSEEGRTEVTAEEQEGDLEKGTGIWQHKFAVRSSDMTTSLTASATLRTLVILCC